MDFTYRQKGVCSTTVSFSIDDEGKLHDVAFQNGCEGNLKAIGRLVENQDARQVAKILEGNDCRGRGTSCADQLAKNIEDAVRTMNV